MKLITQKQIKNIQGFILPLTLLVCLIILMISTGISVILSKELYFSKVSRESQLAYYSADEALMCAIVVDDKYLDPTTGLGIFPYNGLSTNTTADMQATLDQVNQIRQSRGFSTITLNDIKCATVAVLNPLVSSFTTSPFSRVNSSGVTENGQKSTFSMRMDLGGGSFRCANVLVYKTSTYRQIISRGFSSCGDSAARSIERAVVSTTEVR
ncbi:MAG: hypothetical protein WCT07_00760 [Candidatus Paceibacterota bacterium]|jgi:hypothetical protein